MKTKLLVSVWLLQRRRYLVWHEDSIKNPGVLFYSTWIDLGRDENSMIKLIVRSSVLQFSVYLSLHGGVLGSTTVSESNLVLSGKVKLRESWNSYWYTNDVVTIDVCILAHKRHHW